MTTAKVAAPSLESLLNSGQIGIAEYIQRKEGLASAPSLTEKMKQAPVVPPKAEEGFFSSVWGNVSGLVGGAVGTVKDAGSSFIDTMQSAGSSAATKIKEAVAAPFKATASAASDVASSISQTLFRFGILTIVMVLVLLLAYSKLKKEVGA